MCRNIKPLFNFEPAVSDDEIHAASLQFVRKISGFSKPSRANEAAFNAAVEEIAAIAGKLLNSLESNAPPEGPGGRGSQSEGALSTEVRRVSMQGNRLGTNPFSAS